MKHSSCKGNQLNKDDAKDALEHLLSVHIQESVHWADIDKAVRLPSDAELHETYQIPVRGKNVDRQMQIARQSFNPLLQLTLDTYSQSLKVDNYFRSMDDGDVGRSPSDAWRHWQQNRMDARQTGLHHAAMKYGLSYASVLPADIAPYPSLGQPEQRGAAIDVFNPKRMVSLYGERWDFEEYPILALQLTDNGFRLYDEQYVYFFGVEAKPRTVSDWLNGFYTASDNLKYIERREHSVGVTPIVRYRDRMMTEGEESHGMVEPLVQMADRINMTNFQEGMSRHWAAFKQRYVIGWAPKDEMEAFRQSVADTMFFRDDKSKVAVGQFAETDLSQYSESRQRMEQAFAAVAQLPATVLGASAISNVSAEGLAALERSKESKSSEVQTSLGESHEQLFRLCAHISGDSAGAADFGAEVQWKDTSAKTLAQTVDALGKMASMLGVPVEELWPEIPGWTQQQVERAKRVREEQMLLDPLAGTEFASAAEVPSVSTPSEPDASDRAAEVV